MRIRLATDNEELFEVASKIGTNKVIDMGASIRIPAKKKAFSLTLNAIPVRLSAANGRDIECVGETVDAGIPGLRRSYTWTVVAADTVQSWYFLTPLSR